MQYQTLKYVPGDRDTYADYLNANSLFHRQLARASHNDRLEAMVMSVLDELQRPLYLGLDVGLDAEGATREHVLLVGAVRDRDPEARAASRSNKSRAPGTACSPRSAVVMKRIGLFALLLTLIGQSAAAQSTIAIRASIAARFAFRHDDPLGLYAIPAGEWKGSSMEYIGEWIMSRYRIPIREYELLARQFNPVRFNADE